MFHRKNHIIRLKTLSDWGEREILTDMATHHDFQLTIFYCTIDGKIRKKRKIRKKKWP